MLATGAPLCAQVQAVGIRPQLLKDVGVDQKLDNPIPLNLEFRDAHGNTVALSQFFQGKPVLLSLVYYQCPMLCTEVLDGVLQSLKQISLTAGRDFEVVVVSIDPRDRPSDGDAKEVMFTSLYGRPGTNGWHFLTGQDLQIHELANALGFRYAFDPVTGQYAHAAAVMILTPDGRVSRYFYGVHYASRDLRLGLVEASADKIGSLTDDVLLYCYHYDPHTGRYGVVISNVLRAGGIVTVLGLGLLIFFLVRSGQHSLGGRHA